MVGSEKNRVGSEVGSSQNQPGSFQNQPPPADPPASTSRSRKRGLSALLQDVTNTDQMECRRSAVRAKRDLGSQSTVYAPRRNPKRGGKLRQTVSVGEVHEPAHLQQLVSDNELLSDVCESLGGYIQRNVSYEVQKGIAIHILVTAITKWDCTILEAAQHAADCCGFN